MSNPISTGHNAILADPTKRVQINVNLFNVFEYVFIDHLKQSDGGCQPFGAGFSATTLSWPQMLDSDGYPNNAAVSGITFVLGNARTPAASSFGGPSQPYVLTWTGEGRVQVSAANGGSFAALNQFIAGTCTISGANITFANSFIAGQDVYFTTTGSLPTGLTVGIPYYVVSTGNPFQVSATPGGSVITTSGAQSGTHTANPSFTGTTNAWTTISGRAKTRVLLDYTGSTIPSLNLFSCTSTGGTAGFLKNVQFYRLEDETDLLAGNIFRRGLKQLYLNRNPSLIRFMNWGPSNATLEHRFENRNLPSNANYVNSYIAGPRYATTTGTNQYSLASATGMPVAMQHGEVVTCRIGNSVSATAGTSPVSSITQASVGLVTTSVSHGYSNGDVVIHQMMSNIPGQAPAGMIQLDNIPCIVSNVTATTYNIATYPGNVPINTAGYGAFTIGQSYRYVSLNVGSRGDYPVVWGDGVSPITRFSPNLIAGTNRSFIFNKDMIFNAALGAGCWLTSQSSGEQPFINGTPIEICTAFCNEMVAMGWVGDMWVTLPHTGLLSFDQDYSTGSNYATNMVSVIINGANGYAGLNSKCNLIVEHSNETWNTGFNQSNFMKRIGYQLAPGGGTFDVDSYSSLRAVRAVEDIKAAFPGNARIKFSLGMFGIFGSTGGNAIRFTGGAVYNAFVNNIWGNAPIAHFDTFHFATYFSNPNNSTGSDGIVTCTADWLALAGDSVGQEAICARYVLGLIGNNTNNSTISYWLQTLIPQYSAAGKTAGKKGLSYEGGLETLPVGHTTDNNSFLAAVRVSNAWKTAFMNYFQSINNISGITSPCDWLMVGANYGHCPVDTYGSGSVEGGALDQTWTALCNRNNGL